MLTTVVFMFAVCWLPYHMYFVLIYFVDGLQLTGNLQHIFLAIYFMGVYLMSPSLSQPNGCRPLMM